MSLVKIEETGDGIVEVILNRPEKLNALSLAMIEELTLQFRSLAKRTDLRVLILRSSTPGAFCVGADLSERLKMSADEVRGALDKLRDLMDALASFPSPTIAVLEGAAFGGGFELALACDLRLASVTAQMGLTETRLAIIPGAGGTQRLARLVGTAKAKELIFMGKRLNAGEALIMNLIHQMNPDPTAEARRWAKELLKSGPIALRAAKIAIDDGASLPLSKALDVERAAYEITIDTQDRLEGLKAFSEKREPKYSGS